ncbi:hypothetical protein [Paraburkholderia unamae]|uniref:Uncharacterized protein n=1 Tax=Paraburkholderia unamae TaxID=219649 RepID=A0ABX5KCH3_9BURK|nr:hypothetical protein [Paraburkholderia unamae]PVX61222.1 hypothetical protein C7402_14213 [Paraburkholderia unamae]
MSEIDVINERLQRGDERFAEIANALSGITAHLKQQDETMVGIVGKLDKVAQGTEDVVSMWNGGVKAVRFFCRMAEAWTFLLRKVLVPAASFLIAVLVLIALISYHEQGHFPTWLADTLKLVLAVL